VALIDLIIDRPKQEQPKTEPKADKKREVGLAEWLGIVGQAKK